MAQQPHPQCEFGFIKELNSLDVKSLVLDHMVPIAIIMSLHRFLPCVSLAISFHPPAHYCCGICCVFVATIMSY